MDYREFLKRQEALREQLTLRMIENKLTFRELSQDIGIALNTLFKFIKNRNGVHLGTLAKINDYLQKKVD